MSVAMYPLSIVMANLEEGTVTHGRISRAVHGLYTTPLVGPHLVGLRHQR